MPNDTSDSDQRPTANTDWDTDTIPDRLDAVRRAVQAEIPDDAGIELTGAGGTTADAQIFVDLYHPGAAPGTLHAQVRAVKPGRSVGAEIGPRFDTPEQLAAFLAGLQIDPGHIAGFFTKW